MGKHSFHIPPISLSATRSVGGRDREWGGFKGRRSPEDDPDENQTFSPCVLDGFTSVSILKPMNDLERFDLATDDFMKLDWVSMHGLLDLADLWRARARVRARWLVRNALDALPDFPLDQLAAQLRGLPWA